MVKITLNMDIALKNKKQKEWIIYHPVDIGLSHYIIKAFIVLQR